MPSNNRRTSVTFRLKRNPSKSLSKFALFSFVNYRGLLSRTQCCFWFCFRQKSFEARAYNEMVNTLVHRAAVEFVLLGIAKKHPNVGKRVHSLRKRFGGT